MPPKQFDAAEIFQAAKSAWEEWRQPHWRAWAPDDREANTVKRLWAIALSSNWRGTGAQKMAHLLRLIPLAIEAAARHPAFSSARTTFWSVVRDPAGIERLGAGAYAVSDKDTIKLYSSQVLRLRLEERTLLLVRAVSAQREITPSALVTQIIEDAMERTPYPPAEALS